MARVSEQREQGDVRNRTKLSTKQTTVLRALEAGKKPEAIAKQMKVSVNGVYGHMRRIEAHGVDLSKYRRSPNGSRRNRRTRKRSANSNGFSPGVQKFLQSLADQEKALKGEARDLDKSIRDAIKTLDDAQTQRKHVSDALSGIGGARKSVRK